MLAIHCISRIQPLLDITVRAVSWACSGTFAQMQVARLYAVTQSMVLLLFPMICDMHCSLQVSKWLPVCNEMSEMLPTFVSTRIDINNHIHIDIDIDVQTSGLVYSGTNNSTLVVFISATQPQQGTANAANWLPAPGNAGFQLILRLYEAPTSVLSNKYEPPAVVRTSAGIATVVRDGRQHTRREDPVEEAWQSRSMNSGSFCNSIGHCVCIHLHGRVSFELCFM